MNPQELRDVRGRAQAMGARCGLDDRCAPVARRIAIAAATIALLSPVAAHACAVCFGSSPDDPFSRGLNWGILFMMTMPFTIVGVIGGWLFYMYRPWRRGTPRSEEPFLNPELTHKESGS
jgi:hypothetical protein